MTTKHVIVNNDPTSPFFPCGSCSSCRAALYSITRNDNKRHCFVNFASALDVVDRDSLWRIMDAGGMPAKLLRLTKVHYASTKTKARTHVGDSPSFKVCAGVRSGCALSLIRACLKQLVAIPELLACALTLRKPR